MKLFLKIFGSITGAGAAIAAIIAVYSYTESLKPAPITKEEIKEIVKTEVAPLRDDILFQWNFLDDINTNQILLKNALVYHLKRDSSTTKMNEIIDLLTGYRNEVKKKQQADSVETKRMSERKFGYKKIK
jgi:hypothetical protein